MRPPARWGALWEQHRKRKWRRTARAVSGARGSRCGGSGSPIPALAGCVSVLGEGVWALRT